MTATPVTVKFTKKQLELIDEAKTRARIKSQGAMIKQLIFVGLNTLIAQWREEDFNAHLAEWHEKNAWGGDRKSEKFGEDQPK